MKKDNIPYEKQIFVCVNDRRGEKPSCGDHHAEAIFTELRRIAKEKGIHPRIRVTQAKCLGQCSRGTNIMIYPDQVWLSEVEVSDTARIAEEYFPKTKTVTGE